MGGIQIKFIQPAKYKNITFDKLISPTYKDLLYDKRKVNMRFISKLIVSVAVAAGVSCSVNGVCPKDFPLCGDVVGHIASFLDVKSIHSLASVNKTGAFGTQYDLNQLKEWKDGGGLLIALYGAPTDNDRFMLKKFPSIVHEGEGESYSYDELLKLLTSYVRIRDEAMIPLISDNMRQEIETNARLSDWEKRAIQYFLPDADIENLSYLFGGRTWVNDREVTLTPVLKKRLMIRLINDVRSEPKAISLLAQHMFSSFKDRHLVLPALKRGVRDPRATFKEMVLLMCYQSMLTDYRESNRSCDLILGHADTTFGWRLMIPLIKGANIVYLTGYNLYCAAGYLWKGFKGLIKY